MRVGKPNEMKVVASARGIRKTFPKPSGGELLVLDDITFDLPEGEIVCLLGRSGSGKSTLLRILAGLLEPTAGEVIFDGQQVRGPAPGIAMVFQSFALFPWLTVLGNVQLGLEALGLPRDEVRSRALAAIDLIGLDGFESAYPKELSGGMRQRVGFARALVVHPTLLLMDEAFSALDVVTAENLRAEFLQLWAEERLPIRSVLMVTHNIEEAVLMGDRIVILSTNPGRIATSFEVHLPRPRERFDPQVRELIDSVYSLMTARPLPVAKPPALPTLRIAEPLRQTPVSAMAGLLEIVASPPFDGHADLPILASRLQMDGDELFRVVELSHRLGLADLREGDILLTGAGKDFVGADLEGRKSAFRDLLLAHVPLAKHIRSVLDSRPGHRAPAIRFRTELEDQLSFEDADEALRSVTDWGRFAELFAYDDQAEEFNLEDPS